MKEQLSFDEAIYLLPDSDNQVQTTGPNRPTSPPRTRQKKTGSKTVQQAFLPGLSRRGRPRSKNPIPPTVRANESRKRRLEAGIKRIELFLEASIARDLEILTEHFKISRAEVIGRLIGKAARQLQRKTEKAVSAGRVDQAL